MMKRLLFVLCLLAVPLTVGQAQLASITPLEEPAYVCPPCTCDNHGTAFHEAGTCPSCGMALVRETDMKNVALIIHDGVELLDFTGPGEVFAATRAFNVYTVAPTKDAILSQGFLKVTPDYVFSESPPPDILVIPGGGTRQIMDNEAMMAWVADVAGEAEVVMSVCTGAFVLARLGLLDGREATTWHGQIDGLRREAPKTVIHKNTRFVDNGRIVTTAGVSAGIDGALHVVSRLLGEEKAREVARYMEYDKWVPEAGLILSESQ